MTSRLDQTQKVSDSDRNKAGGGADDHLNEARQYTLHDVQNLPKIDAIALKEFPKCDDFFHKNDKVAAAEKLDALIDPKMDKADQQTMRDLDSAIAAGDSKAFAEAIERFRGDPEGLQKFMGMLNDNLKKAESGVSVAAYGENALIMGRDQAVEISTDGKAVVRNMERMGNGLIKLSEPIHDANPSYSMESIGSGARFHILADGHRTIPKTPAFIDARPTR